ncbi:hypothetical protein [Deinococcus navajonensis]|uniref:Uncharacterized protein n=1 Tax=Deinococcus navajonensis TaxID=309884 RepID=A0ABV8XJF4_9DEIO
MPGDEPDQTDVGEATAADPRDHFKAYWRTATYDLTAFSQQTTGVSVVAEAWRLTDMVKGRSSMRLQLEHQHLRVAVQAPGQLQFTQEPWTTYDTLRFLARQLRRYLLLSEADLQAMYHRWVPAEQGGRFPDLRLYPDLFVPDASGQWTLTTWARLGKKFSHEGVGSWGWSRRLYVREAARFWLTQQHLVPAPDQEWDPAVRELVAQTLAAPKMPAYLEPCKVGPFVRQTASGIQEYRLDLDAMPEGTYFTMWMNGMFVTFSVNGRAFWADSPSGIALATPFFTMRMKEALTWPEGDAGVVWHETGLEVKGVLRRFSVVIKVLH